MSAVLNPHKHKHITIEQAGFQHDEEIADFYDRQKSALSENAHFLKGKTPADFFRQLKQGAMFLAREGENGPLAGMVGIAPELRRDFARASGAEVNSLVIAPAYIRNGVAGSLLTACEDWAKARRLNHLFAKVVSGAQIDGVAKPGNTAGRATFERQGYVHSGETERHGDPNVKLWVLTKTL
jgi:GNAT superfamily N-acetyltransferase